MASKCHILTKVVPDKLGLFPHPPHRRAVSASLTAEFLGSQSPRAGPPQAHGQSGRSTLAVALKKEGLLPPAGAWRKRRKSWWGAAGVRNKGGLLVSWPGRTLGEEKKPVFAK